MAAQHWLTGILAATTLGFAGIAWREYATIQQLQIQVLQFQTEDPLLHKQVADLQRHNQALQHQVADFQRAAQAIAASLRAARPAPEGGSAPSGSAEGPAASGPPGRFQLSLAQMNAIVDRRFGAFLASLPPDQAQALKDLLTKRQEAANDAVDALLQQGVNLGANVPTLRRAIADAESPFDSEIAGQLGADGFADFKQFVQTTSQRNTVSDLKQVLASSGAAALTNAQTTALIPLIAQTEQPDDGGGVGRTLYGGMNYHSKVTPATISAASGVLSPPQVQALQTLMQRQSSAPVSR